MTCEFRNWQKGTPGFTPTQSNFPCGIPGQPTLYMDPISCEITGTEILCRKHARTRYVLNKISRATRLIQSAGFKLETAIATAGQIWKEEQLKDFEEDKRKINMEVNPSGESQFYKDFKDSQNPDKVV